MQRNVNFISWLLISQNGTLHDESWWKTTDKQTNKQANKSKNNTQAIEQFAKYKMMNEIDCFFYSQIKKKDAIINVKPVFLILSPLLLVIDIIRDSWIKIVSAICAYGALHISTNYFKFHLDSFSLSFNLALIMLDFLYLPFCPNDNTHTHKTWQAAHGEWRRRRINCSNWNKIIIKLLESVINPILSASFTMNISGKWISVCLYFVFSPHLLIHWFKCITHFHIDWQRWRMSILTSTQLFLSWINHNKVEGNTYF